MSFQCPQSYEAYSKSNAFEPKCGTDVFKTTYTSWDNMNEKYLNHINKINDPILKYIALYFVQYYMDGHKYYRNSDNHQRSAACTYLTRWFLKKKDLFTYGNNCPTKLYSWNNSIETLREMLMQDSNYFDKENKSWCPDYKMSEFTKFPLGLTSPNCDETISEKSSSDVLLPITTEKDCHCPQNEVLANIPQIGESQDIQPTRKIAFTSGFTAAGTLGTLLLLYKYTPVSSWFRRRGMNNIGSDLYMNPGSPDGFLRMQHDNGDNNIFYQP